MNRSSPNFKFVNGNTFLLLNFLRPTSSATVRPLMVPLNTSLKSSLKTYGRSRSKFEAISVPSVRQMLSDTATLKSENFLTSTLMSEREATCNSQGAIQEQITNWTGLINETSGNSLGSSSHDHINSTDDEIRMDKHLVMQKEFEMEAFETYSDASSDGFSVDEALSWKNDQNRDERLLPLKRLKKGYTSSNCRRQDSTKLTEWTESITIYDSVISSALADHANYARRPPAPSQTNLNSASCQINTSPTTISKLVNKEIDVLPEDKQRTDIPKDKKTEFEIDDVKNKTAVTSSDTVRTNVKSLSEVIKPDALSTTRLPKDSTETKKSVKPRGRPRSSFKRHQSSASARSYRNILRRSRLGRPIRSVVRDNRDISFDRKLGRMEGVKRPVGRPRKYDHSSPLTPKKLDAAAANKTGKIIDLTKENEQVIVLPKKLYQQPKLEEKLKVKKETVNAESINFNQPFRSDQNDTDKDSKKLKVSEEKSVVSSSPIVAAEKEQRVVESNLKVSSTVTSSEKLENQVKDPLINNDISIIKRPKGRPKNSMSMQSLSKEMDESQMKRKRGRPCKFRPSLLQSMRKEKDKVHLTYISFGDSSEEGKKDATNSSTETVRQNDPINPTNWFSQLSRRSSLRQVECAFRYREIVVKKQENFIHIVLTSNTRVKNGLNCQVLNELKTALMAAKNDNKCHCIMLSGTGGVFCSGVDLISLSNDKSKTTADNMSSAIRDFCKTLMTFPKPLVAAVNGCAVGLGVSMLPYFDLVYATDKATFYSPYAKLGQVPEGGATFLLPTIMGYARANGLLLEGRKLTATEAYDCGIVTQVLWPATFMEEVVPRVQALANRPLQPLESTKALVRYHALSKLEVTLDTECRLLCQYWSSDECRQIIKDFLQNEEVV